MGRYVRPKPARLTEKLREIRSALGLSQNGMLNKLGLAETHLRTTVSSYERGSSEPPLEILLKYARLAGVCMDVIVDDQMDLPSLPSRAQHSVTTGVRRKSGR